MKKLYFALAALPFMASIAMAGQPVTLTDAQMDKVTAGQIFIVIVVAPASPDDAAVNTITNPPGSAAINHGFSTVWAEPPGPTPNSLTLAGI